MNNEESLKNELTKRKRSRPSEDQMLKDKEIEDYSLSTEYKTKLSSFLASQFTTNFQILQSDFILLEDYEKVFFKDTSLDVMFIMDITGSMGMWLSEAKTQLSNIIEEITNNNPCSKIRMSFVGYRDFLEDIEIIGQYASLDFTESVEEVNTFISKISAYGGGDEPEDLAGALDIALKMNWQSSARYCVLVCDAPCHGNQYHNSIYDKYTQGDPKGLVLETLIEEFVKKNITLYCVEINSSTRKMMSIMNQIYLKNSGKEMNIETLGNAINKFAFFVALGASNTLGNITYNKVKLEDVIRQFRDETIEKILKKYNKEITEINNNLADLLENMNLDESELKMCNFISRMNSLNITQSLNNNTNYDHINQLNSNHGQNNKTSISFDNTGITIISQDIIEKDAFNFSVENNYITIKAICHSVFFPNSNNLISDWSNLLTLHKTIDTEIKLNKEALLSENAYSIGIKDSLLEAEGIGLFPVVIENDIINLQHYLSQYTQYEVMNQIANYFNIKQLELFPGQKNYIKFRPRWLYEFNSKFIHNFVQFEQTNIQGNKTEVSKFLKEAFSHFSYQITEGFLIVTDLIDKKGIIIDQKFSTIQSPNYPIGGINEGYKGIMQFFVKHFCNDTCRKLNLLHPRKKGLKDFKDFYYRNSLLAPKICDLCTQPFNGEESSCFQCITLLSKNEKKGKCESCNGLFQYSHYSFIKKKINLPTQCQSCRSSFAD